MYYLHIIYTLADILHISIQLHRYTILLLYTTSVCTMNVLHFVVFVTVVILIVVLGLVSSYLMFTYSYYLND